MCGRGTNYRKRTAFLTKNSPKHLKLSVKYIVEREIERPLSSASTARATLMAATSHPALAAHASIATIHAGCGTAASGHGSVGERRCGRRGCAARGVLARRTVCIAIAAHVTIGTIP